MNKSEITQLEKKYNPIIIALSVIIPLAVAVILFGIKIEATLPLFLPPIYAIINGLTAMVLILAFIAIKNKNIKRHERFIKIAIALSVLFLIMYVLYHITSKSTPYGGQGILKLVYFIILISHILLSIIVIPFVLITYFRGITNQVEKHKKIAKYTFPLWLYVTITGVIVYIMIAPYYA